MSEGLGPDDEGRLREIIEFLTESHLDMNGGYPYAHRWIGSTLIVAELDHDGATSISAYKKRSLIAWHKRAQRFAKVEGQDMEAAFFETDNGLINGS